MLAFAGSNPAQARGETSPPASLGHRRSSPCRGRPHKHPGWTSSSRGAGHPGAPLPAGSSRQPAPAWYGPRAPGSLGRGGGGRVGTREWAEGRGGRMGDGCLPRHTTGCHTTNRAQQACGDCGARVACGGPYFVHGKASRCSRKQSTASTWQGCEIAKERRLAHPGIRGS